MTPIIFSMLLLTACRQGNIKEVATHTDEDGDGYESDVDCDDANPNVFPEAGETCDGLDNNCDGEIDEGVTLIFYQDVDSDGFGNETITTSACAAPEGYVADNTDCNDENASAYPNAPEICDTVDNNCDGLIDEEDPMLLNASTWFVDRDNDGFGIAEDSITACFPSEGYAPEANDCDDSNPARNPGADEICDGIDNDCDELVEAELGLIQECPALQCKAILEAHPNSLDGVYWIQPDRSLPVFEAWCDMTTDDGGWTLLITLDPATVTFPKVANWPDYPEPSGAAPTYAGLYKGSLAEFSEVREEIASGSVVVYGSGLSESALNLIRELYGYNSRMAAAPLLSDPPNCALSYGAPEDIVGCSSKSNLSNTDGIIGWAADPTSTYHTYCWFARGNCCSAAGGSSHCNGETDGTQWARTWFR